MTSRVMCVVLMLALAGACAGKGEEGEAGRPLPNPDASAELPILPIGGDFTLTDQNGRPFSLSSLEGKAVLIFFGYTMCPDACPTTLSKLSTATARLSDAERRRVKVLYITIDPERDTPAVLKEHLGYFSVDTTGLTGSVEDITKVAAQYGAHFEKTGDKTAAGYLMSHTVSVFGLDEKGRTRMLIDYDAGVDSVVKDIQRLLAAG
jgi:protein SCO1/2